MSAYTTTSRSPPATPAISVVGDTLTANRYAGVLLDQGWTSVSGDNITGGNVGIGVLQYNGQYLLRPTAARRSST